jgi:hypothetical protein
VDDAALDELLRTAGAEAVPPEDIAPLHELLAAHAELVRPLLAADTSGCESALDFDPAWRDPL